MKQDRVEEVLEYALLTAGEQDFGSRELGPIHLIKYVYLADLAHAERRAGETFTETPWVFYKFGPWSAQVFALIATTVAAIGAETKTYHSYLHDADAVRYHARNPARLSELESKLPAVVLGSVRRSVRDFGTDTASLLNHVYRTAPMLRAAPNEQLDFSVQVPEPVEVQSPEPSPAPLSGKARRARDAAIRDLRARVQRGDARDTEEEFVVPSSPVPYDEDYHAIEGLLAADAGDLIGPQSGELLFLDELWKSSVRGDPGDD